MVSEICKKPHLSAALTAIVLSLIVLCKKEETGSLGCSSSLDIVAFTRSLYCISLSTRVYC